MFATISFFFFYKIFATILGNEKIKILMYQFRQEHHHAEYKNRSKLRFMPALLATVIGDGWFANWKWFQWWCLNLANIGNPIRFQRSSSHPVFPIYPLVRKLSSTEPGRADGFGILLSPSSAVSSSFTASNTNTTSKG